MGFAASGASAWQVDGTIKDIYVESKQIPYGATLFWGFMDVDFRLAHAGGAAQTVSMRLHNYNGGYNAGMGARTKPRWRWTHLLVKARRRRGHSIGCTQGAAAPAVPRSRPDEATAAVGHVRTGSRCGSRRPRCAPLVPKEPDEKRRSSLIEALGRLAPRAVPVPASATPPRTRTAAVTIRRWTTSADRSRALVRAPGRRHGRWAAPAAEKTRSQGSNRAAVREAGRWTWPDRSSDDDQSRPPRRRARGARPAGESCRDRLHSRGGRDRRESRVCREAAVL